jgi:hypothetical protein
MSAAPQQDTPPRGQAGATTGAGAVRLGPLDALILITDRLVDLITAENEMLKTRRPSELNKQIDEKQRLAAMYAREMAALQKEPARVAAAAPADAQHLRETTARFRALVEENGRRVNAMRIVSERMIKAVGDEIAKRNRAVSAYDKKAAVKPASASWQVARPASLALDQRV